MSILKLLPASKGKRGVGTDPTVVISLEGEEDESSDLIEEEDIEEVRDRRSNFDNDPDVMEVISLVDDEEEERIISDENDDSPIHAIEIVFLDAENKKVHKYIKMNSDEDDSEFVDVDGASSDSDIEEVIDKDCDTRVYISIDPEDYKKVNKEISNPDADRVKSNIKFCQVDTVRPRKDIISDSSKSKNPEGIEKTESPVITDKAKRLVDTIDILKGPNIPKAICCHSCSYVCFKEEELSLHISVKHPSKFETLRTYTAAEIQELEREMKDQADDCASCGQALWYLPTLRAHAMIHPSGKATCDACHHGTSVIKLLMDHLESHVGSDEEDSDL